MAIRFVLPAEEAESVAFAYSPVVEAVLSLHVLVAPKHHPLQHAWVRRMRALDSTLRAEIRAFAFAYWDHFPDFLFPRPDHEFLDFEDELAQLHELDAETIAFEFLRPMYDHEGSWPRPQALLARQDVKTHAVQRAQRIAGEDGAALARLMFADPRELARRFARLLERYWSEAFADEWRRIEPILANAVQDAGSRLPTEGVLGVLGDHQPRLQIDADRRRVWIRLPHEHEVAVSPQEPLVLSPSMFVWPHVRVNCDPPFPVGLIYPAQAMLDEAAPKLPPDELLRILRALADETRLRALALIAERPRTTQELAPLLGLVLTRREGYYVLYSLVPERMRPLSAALLAFVRSGA